MCRHVANQKGLPATLVVFCSLSGRRLLVEGAVDPLEAPGVGTPWPGGLTFREAHLAMELLADAGQVSSMEVVEVNPIHDHENRTAKLAADLILSALGRTIA